MAISKIVAKSVDFQAADGEMDNDYALRIANAEATDGRSYGLRIDAGSTSDEAFIVKDHDSSNTLIKIDGYGHITKPKQPAFLAVPSSTVTNISKDGTNTIAFGTEVFDQNGDFSTPNFTAPVTGRYQLSLMVYLYQVQSDATYYFTQIVTSNRTYTTISGTTLTYEAQNTTVIADMDASDTALVKITSSNDSDYQVGGGSGETSFFGCLLA